MPVCGEVTGDERQDSLGESETQLSRDAKGVKQPNAVSLMQKVIK